MPLNPQQRSLAILAGVFGGGLLITFLLVSLVSGGDDDKRKISIGPKQTTTTSSTTTLPPTLATIPTTVPTTVPNPVTLPPTSPPNTIPPGTIQTAPTSPPATSPSTTKPPSTTTTTKPKTTAEKLDDALEDALLGSEAPPPGGPARVTVEHIKATNRYRITWKLDDSTPDDEQWYRARQEATTMLEVIQGFAGLDDEDIVLRGTLADPVEPDERNRVVFARYTRATLDGIDFTTFDPLTVFDEPPAEQTDLDPPIDGTPPPTTTTSSTTTTTTP